MFRILTEDKDVDRIKATLNGLGLDFTIFSGRGSWNGQEENSLAIELDNIIRCKAGRRQTPIKKSNERIQTARGTGSRNGRPNQVPLFQCSWLARAPELDRGRCIAFLHAGRGII